LEAANPFGSTIWNNAPDALGGNGVPSGSCITTGPFASSTGWMTSQSPPQCLMRGWFNFSGAYATEADISQTTNVNCPLASQFQCFENQIQGYHNNVHASIGGQMGYQPSANDPVFFWHHAYIDLLWARWQSKSYANTWALYNSATYMNASMPGTTWTPADFMDLKAQYSNPANQVCYIELDQISWISNIWDTLAAVNPELLAAVPRVAMSPFPASWLCAMNMSAAEIAAAKSVFDARNNQPFIISRTQAIAAGGLAASLGNYIYDSYLQQVGYGPASASNIELDGSLSPQCSSYTNYDNVPQPDGGPSFYTVPATPNADFVAEPSVDAFPVQNP